MRFPDLAAELFHVQVVSATQAKTLSPHWCERMSKRSRGFRSGQVETRARALGLRARTKTLDYSVANGACHTVPRLTSVWC